MADLQVKDNTNRRGRRAPNVDLTPMVDLGFILITFFIYTTTMNQPNLLTLNMPYEPAETTTAYTDTSTMTIIPINNHKVVFYNGALTTEQDLCTADFATLRTLLPTKQLELKALPNSFSKQAHQLQVIIKPHKSSTYADMVAVLDEMKIHDIQIYTMADLSLQEETLINDKL
ncbi:MAG: biopolymer transporter ExbD [Flavipsychrobacter sp.]